MGSVNLLPKERGADINKLTPMMRMFVVELLADPTFNGKNAAKKAGYKIPGNAANKLLKDRRIQAAVGKAIRQRAEKIGLDAESVLRYLETALFHNPLEYFTFKPGVGYTVINPDDIPPEIGRLIDSIELKKFTDNDGNVTESYKVKLISKSTVLPLVMKHLGMLTDKQEIKQTIGIDLEQLYQQDTNQTDLIEQRLEEERNNG